jgi:hypothetical protein
MPQDRLGLILLVALFYYGSIDLASLRGLARQPGAVAVSALLLLLTLPLAALRWSFSLRILGLPLPWMTLLHVQAIATFTNQFLLGTASADAVRGVYAWRALRGNSPRIALSLVADRALSFAALMLLTMAFMLVRWDRVSAVAPLTALLVSVMLALGAMVVGALALMLAPTVLDHLLPQLSPVRDWPRSCRRSVPLSWRFAATYRPRRRLLPPRWLAGPSISWRRRARGGPADRHSGRVRLTW